MKKNLFFAIIGLTVVLFATSCSKSDPGPTNTNTVVGKWDGSITPNVGPSHLFTLNFKTGGSFAVDSSSASFTDLATGTWVLATDSVRATYTFLTGGSGTYSLAGNYSSDFKTMNGTIGVGSSTSGYAIFSVAK